MGGSRVVGVRGALGALSVLFGVAQLCGCGRTERLVSSEPELPRGTGPAGGALGGTRLAARYLVNASGTGKFESMVDTQLNVDCHFVHTGVRGALDEYRCLDTVAAGKRYLDASCTESVAAVSSDPCADIRTGRLVRLWDGCDPEFFSLGTEVTASEVFTIGDAGDCVRADDAGHDRYYTLATAELEGYVAGVLRKYAAEAEPKLELWVVEADDGAEQVIELAYAGAPCEPWFYADGTYTCVSITTSTVICGEKRAVYEARFERSCLFERERFAVVLEPLVDGCHGTRIHRVGQRLAAGACNLPEQVGADGPFALGPEVPRQDLPSLSLQADADQQVESVFLQAAGQRLDFAYFQASATARRCSPALLADGSYRCVPGSAGRTSRFADADCSEPVTYQVELGCPTPAPPLYAVTYLPRPADGVDSDEARCAQTLDSIREYEPYSGPVFELDDAGVCSPADPGSFDYLIPGEPIAANTFPELVHVLR